MPKFFPTKSNSQLTPCPKKDEHSVFKCIIFLTMPPLMSLTVLTGININKRSELSATTKHPFEKENFELPPITQIPPFGY